MAPYSCPFCEYENDIDDLFVDEIHGTCEVYFKSCVQCDVEFEITREELISRL